MNTSDKPIWDAWEHIHYALRESMRSLDTEVLKRLAQTEGNMAVADVATDELAARGITINP